MRVANIGSEKGAHCDGYEMGIKQYMQWSRNISKDDYHTVGGSRYDRYYGRHFA